MHHGRDVRSVLFADLTPDQLAFWDGCIAVNPELTPFHSRQWLTSWATAYDATNLCFVLASLDQEGRLGALLPLMRWKDTVRSLSYNATDYTGMIWARDRGASAAALAEHISVMVELEPIVLWNVRATDPLISILSSNNRLQLVSRTPISSIDLAASRFRPWNQLARVSSRELARKKRRLSELDIDVAFARSVEASTVDEMVDIHTRSWKQRGGPGSFEDTRRITFVRELVQSGLQMLFVLMRLGRRLVSYRFGPIDNRTYYDWNTGTDPEYARESPGLVLLQLVLERLQLSERAHTVDFLRGSEDYKRAWVTETGWISEYAVLPLSMSRADL
jgi:CelD/BcsL family acetyltransferase involved in cellulose biosynthesis